MKWRGKRGSVNILVVTSLQRYQFEHLFVCQITSPKAAETK